MPTPIDDAIAEVRAAFHPDYEPPPVPDRVVELLMAILAELRAIRRAVEP